jgi:hypothetical protein
MLLALTLVLAVTPPEVTPAGCDAPGASLSVHSHRNGIVVGEKQRLPLWLNRKHAEVRFHWVLRSAPPGSTAVVGNPLGETNAIAPQTCEVAYVDAVVPVFTPDVPGRYELDVTVVDVQRGDQAHAVAVLEATAPPRYADAAPGCSAGGGGALVLALLLVRRRRA